VIRIKIIDFRALTNISGNFTTPQTAHVHKQLAGHYSKYSTCDRDELLLPWKNIRPCDNPDCRPPSLHRRETVRRHNTASCGQGTTLQAGTGFDSKSTTHTHTPSDATATNLLNKHIR